MVAWIDEVNEAVLNIPKPSYSPACTNYTYYNPNTTKPGVNLSSNRNMSQLKNERKNNYYRSVFENNRFIHIKVPRVQSPLIDKSYKS